MAADKVFDETLEMVKGLNFPGLVSCQRTVCKSEWAYELAMIFEAEHFAGYMESPDRENVLQPQLGKFVELAKDGEMYIGNRVYDEYKP